MLVHPEQLLDTVSRITCGDEHGTGFFISPSRLLTARHVIVDHITDSCEIVLRFPSTDYKEFVQISAILIGQDEDLDIAVLEISDQGANQSYLSVSLDHIRYNEEWITFGYPFLKLAEGQHLIGTVLALIRDLPYDLSLISDDIETRLDYSGLSGAPLIVHGKVAGIITWSTIRGLGAISIKKVNDFLLSNNVEIENIIDTSWSNDFLAEMDRTVANDDVISKLQEALYTSGRYYLLHGAPGSGKSIISSTLELQAPNAKVIGRYLIRTLGDPIPIYVKATRENFMQWMEDLVSKTLIGEPAAKNELVWNERVVRLASWLVQLNDYFSAKSEYAVIIVDGLDELLLNGSNNTNDFLSVLPEILPTHLTVLLSCTTAEILPDNISSGITDEQKIYVTPLSQPETARFIHQENLRLDLSLSLTQERLLVPKSEGHPLYLRYLIETLKNNLPEDIDLWISSLPSIGGDIKKYYELLWSAQIVPDGDKYWIALIGSQLREPVATNEFKNMLPDSARYNFQAKFANIRHLFKTGGKVSIYHNSFENFVAEKGEADLKDANKQISDYNLSASQSVYGLKNRLHHLLLSPDPVPSISNCDQRWADACALVHMEPDMIIDDIQRIEALCIDQGDVSELIRVKLLLQRLRFRYNNVLAKHAYEITDALIQMGNSKDALKYILREDLLLVSLDNAIYFLQKLYETGAYIEASLLNDAIDIRYKAMLERAVRGEGMSLKGFVFNLQAITLKINIEDIENVMPKFLHGVLMLKDLEDFAGTPEEDKEDIYIHRKYICAWNMGYFIYRFNRYPGIEKIAEFSDDIYNDTTAAYLAQTAINYHQFKGIGIQGSEDNSSYIRLMSDIERMITDYGYRDEDTEFLIKTLIEETKNPTLIEGLINKQLENRVEFNFRKSNGVDADSHSFIELFNERIYDGYIDKANAFPIVSSKRADSWELFFKSSFELAGFITGKVYRIKSEDRVQALNILEQKAKDLVLKLNFTLLERTKFERSYQLIETVVPILYHRLIILYLEFQPSVLSWFIDHIISSSANQLGQYTEGYRASIYRIAEYLAQFPLQKQYAFKLIKLLEEHVDIAVQNRWQRTPELIQIVNLYAKIGSIVKAKQVYQMMLDTSMGPSWYKEGQLALVNTVLRRMNVDSASEHYVDFAAYLEFASGEMTFQRYVQSEMHSYVGTLAKAGHLSKAINYFKFQVLPSPAIILANAESSIIDAPSKGDGYILGARTIIEPSAMLSLLKAVEANPMLVIALSEVFLISSDTERYMDGLAEVQYSAYQHAKSISEQDSDHVLMRLTTVVLSPRLKDEKAGYIYQLFKAFGDEFAQLEEKLLEAGLNPDIIPEKKHPKVDAAPREYTPEEDAKMAEFGLPFPGVGKMSNFSKIAKANQLAQKEFDIENNEGGRKILIDCLTMLHDDEADIWQGGHLTSELGELFDLLTDYSSAVEIISVLKDRIINHLTDDWYVVSYLMKLLENKLPDQEKEKLILIIKEHIETLIQSKGIFSEKYQWLNIANEIDGQADSNLARFLIWLLNHPYASVQKVVLDALHWLAAIQPNLIVPILIEYSISSRTERAAELSAYLLKILAKSDPTAIWNALAGKNTLQDDLFSMEHMMIRIYWRDILAACGAIDSQALALYERYTALFPPGNFAGSDVYLEHPSLLPVDDIIEELNHMKILNRTFCENLMANLSELSLPLSVLDQLRVERYIRRSFYEEDIEFGHYTYHLHSALNKTLVGHVGDSQTNQVSLLLKLPIV